LLIDVEADLYIRLSAPCPYVRAVLLSTAILFHKHNQVTLTGYRGVYWLSSFFKHDSIFIISTWPRCKSYGYHCCWFALRVAAGLRSGRSYSLRHELQPEPESEVIRIVDERLLLACAVQRGRQQIGKIFGHRATSLLYRFFDLQGKEKTLDRSLLF